MWILQQWAACTATNQETHKLINDQCDSATMTWGNTYVQWCDWAGSKKQGTVVPYNRQDRPNGCLAPNKKGSPQEANLIQSATTKQVYHSRSTRGYVTDRRKLQLCKNAWILEVFSVYGQAIWPTELFYCVESFCRYLKSQHNAESFRAANRRRWSRAHEI